MGTFGGGAGPRHSGDLWDGLGDSRSPASWEATWDEFYHEWSRIRGTEVEITDTELGTIEERAEELWGSAIGPMSRSSSPRGTHLSRRAL